MARTVKLSDVRGRIRELGEISATYVSNTNLDVEINQSYLELVDKLVASGAGDYFESTNSQNVVSGTATYSMPSDFYKLLAVDLKTDNNTYANIHRYNIGERNRFNQSEVAAVDREKTMYRLRGSNVVLIPTPAWSETDGIRFSYVPNATEFNTSNANSTIDGIAGWEDWIVYDCLVKFIGGKEEGDASQWERLQAKINARIEDMRNRDNAEPDSIRDIDWEYM